VFDIQTIHFIKSDYVPNNTKWVSQEWLCSKKYWGCLARSGCVLKYTKILSQNFLIHAFILILTPLPTTKCYINLALNKTDNCLDDKLGTLKVPHLPCYMVYGFKCRSDTTITDTTRFFNRHNCIATTITAPSTEISQNFKNCMKLQP